MNYQIIHDEAELDRFLDWLPDLLPRETFYLSLLARKKYCRELKADKCQLKRFTSAKDRIKEKIRQLEISFGLYRSENEPVPQEALSLYITPNPRCFEKAAKESLVRMAELITKPYSGYNPQQEALSAIHRSCSRKIWLDFDFDVPDGFNPDVLLNHLNKECLTLIKTRGGFHALVQVSKIEAKYKTTWYQGLTSIDGLDVRGDSIIPVPGCCQGGFTPHFIST